MKTHAAIGAEILSAIDFPYPVVPIVRHHHENWDGTGYPDGIAGARIPIGARILSVVDCYDALTSDRPYRTRLSDEEALRIVIERRGTMYDPAVVDTFVRMHDSLAHAAPAAAPRHEVLARISDASAAGGAATAVQAARAPAFAQPAASEPATEELLALCTLARTLSPEASVHDIGLLLWPALRRLIPCHGAALFRHDDERGDIVVVRAAGAVPARLQGLRIDAGHRISGWVAAQHQVMINSDAALDLEQAAWQATPPLRSCLSLPLPSGHSVAGVLTLYSTAPAGFSEEHARVLQIAAPAVGQLVERMAGVASRPVPTGRTVLKLVHTGA